MDIPERRLTFANREGWRAWLAEHHATAQEAWLVHYKKNVAKESVSYEEAVEEALCFGWIDGLLRSIDAESYALRYSPRKHKSVWSESNKRRVDKLIREARMTPAGLAKVAEAKANGEWDAAAAREDTSTLPADLATELERNGARAAFDAWPASRKKQALYWLSTARRPETRQRRIQGIVDMVRGGPSPW